MSQAETNPVAIAIHGGAGTLTRVNLTPEMEKAYRDKLTESVEAGHNVLIKGGSSRDAVIAAIKVMEDSPLFNAGHGAVFNHEGEVELDASIMDGKDLAAGAIAGVTRVKNPILLASEILLHSPHVMMVGEGAEVFAQARGIELVDNTYFRTERRRLQLERVKQQETGATALSEDDTKLGTVGAVALDKDGNLAAGTSTGGMTNKQFGRVGDSPIIGAGTYADNNACAVSATGHGEYFIRAAVAHDICARVMYTGVTLQKAADDVVLVKLKDMAADGGIIALDPAGNVVFSFNSTGMYRAAVDKSGTLYVGIFR